MKKTVSIFLSLLLAVGTFSFAGCQKQEKPKNSDYIDAINIHLSDEAITVNGEAISTDETQAVYASNDIIYYEEGHNFTYGEGTKEDEHTKEEADAHTVINITKPGMYAVTGKVSAGQLAIDLGEDAVTDPEAVVDLILNGADITCTVAPAVIFYNVYECGEKDENTATQTVSTSKAGANVIIADNTVNNINGSYVARIYKEFTLNEEGTEVVDSKKLHKYDGAFYSRMSMNINSGAEDSGVLNINAENEGLDSELHLTIYGGNINIVSGNDGINTNEDNISVTTINGGNINITVDGSTGEGDGIDSNGWLVINGGSLSAWACGSSGDAGIDSDKGIHINGGSVYASGNMLDRIEEGGINYAVFSFNSRQKGGSTYSLRNAEKEILFTCDPVNDFTNLIIANESLEEADYTFWQGDTQLAATAGNFGGMGGGMMKPVGEIPEDFSMPEGMISPEGFDNKGNMQKPEGEIPEDFSIPEGMQKPDRQPREGMQPPEMPEGEFDPGKIPGGRQPASDMPAGEISTEFRITKGANYFSSVTPAE
ncbi:MAG: carbohydrate-binding domain-containing protein [Clostridia bacterium]|nr:carbohydrate-binding domain-containing protein [Clostridia bacterium]